MPLLDHYASFNFNIVQNVDILAEPNRGNYFSFSFFFADLVNYGVPLFLHWCGGSSVVVAVSS